MAVVLVSGFALQVHAQAKPRARELGVPFDGTPGPLNAITDISGVEVGQVTREGSGKREERRGEERRGKRGASEMPSWEGPNVDLRRYIARYNFWPKDISAVVSQALVGASLAR